MLNKKMKSLSGCFAALTTIFSLNSIAAFDSGIFKPFAVYGEDNRTEPFSVGAKEFEISKSIAGRISLEHLIPSGNGFKVVRKTLGEEKCSKNRFSEQMIGPTCTGFLVRPNVLVTAGHCMTSADNCTKNVWVFDYALKNAGDKNYTLVSPQNMYKCNRVIARGFREFGNIDYAIVELDRPVTDRNVLELDFNPQSPALDTIMFAAGHPSGLPLKITLNGRVLKNDDSHSFDTDLDIFQGNSGSPVIDQNTGKVLGVTSHGHEDYTRDPSNPSCKIPKICMPGDKCYLSTASRVLNFEQEFKKILDAEKL